jgi:hypothetical protein
MRRGLVSPAKVAVFFIPLACVLSAAFAGPAANVQYIHNAMGAAGVNVPIKASNPLQIANMKYLLCAIDKAREIQGLPDYRYCDTEYATMVAADTIVVHQAIEKFLPIKYKAVEYIRFNNRHYVDPDIAPLDFTETIELSYLNNRDYSLNNTLFAYNAPNDFGYLNNFSFYVHKVNESQYTSTMDIMKDSRVPTGWVNFQCPNNQTAQVRTWKVDFANRTHWCDGAQVPLLGTSDTNPYPDAGVIRFLIGGRSTDNTPLGLAANIYYFKISKGGVMVRDFVPVKKVDGGACGFLDLVGGKFFASATEIGLVCGPETGANYER